MKIGILTLFHNNYNWGGVLQGYALKTLIEKEIEDAQVDILIYKGGRNIVYSNKVLQAMQYSPKDIINKILTRLGNQKNYAVKGKLHERYELFDAFMKEYTTNKIIYSDGNLEDAATEYDCLISGSDQVWNPNVGKAGFFQEMISENCKKISYAASIARDDLSRHERNVMIPLIEKFDAISVREKTAKTIIEKYMSSNKTVTEVLDPALMLAKNDWEHLIGTKTQLGEKYALAFFFSESYEYRKAIQHYCETHGLILKFIPFAKQEYLATDEEGSCERVYNVGPIEFVELFQNAECVFTDSFHGTVFSLIFQKPFLVFERDKKSKVSKNSRLYDLLEKFELFNRLIKDNSNLDYLMEQHIDFSIVETLHQKYKEESMHFLREAIGQCDTRKETNIQRVDHLKKRECCGCALCLSQCPTHCISLKEDEEGFLYPQVDEEKCISCGLCLKNCKKRLEIKGELQLQDTYVGYNSNEIIKKESSSGGVFYALAHEVLKQGGAVYGAAFNEKFEVEHIRIEAKENIDFLMRSKYVQSKMDSVFLHIERDLRAHRTVLFCGTPCQVAAISSFAMSKGISDKLLLVDFVCHGVPSPGVWRTYIEYLEQSMGSQLVYVNFRDKYKGWHNYHFSAKTKNKHIKDSHELNSYMRTFLSDMNIRPSCYSCDFKGDNYHSDITLGDAWKIEKEFPDWADDKGTSVFVVRTQKGKEILEIISPRLMMRKSDYQKQQKFNPSMAVPTYVPNSRKQFFAEYQKQGSIDFWRNRRRISLKKQVRYYLKQVLKFTRLDKVVRKMF